MSENPNSTIAPLAGQIVIVITFKTVVMSGRVFQNMNTQLLLRKNSF